MGGRLDLQYYDGVSDLSKATLVPVRENAATGDIDFRLTRPVPGTGSISGTVREDSDGKPVPGAVVSAYAIGATSGQYTFGKAACDSNGHYIIKSLKSGDYQAQVYGDGYVSEMYENAKHRKMQKRYTWRSRTNRPE